MEKDDSLEIRTLGERDAQSYFGLRLEALEQDPESFAESADEFRKTTPARVAEWLRSCSAENFIIGAFAQGQLVGMAGFYRSKGEKTRHKGHIWGVYVKQGWRRKGIAKDLLKRVIGRAQALDGLQQVSLGVAIAATAAKKLYESLGFEVYGREPGAIRVNDDYVDEELMVLRVREK
jgi:ribosomal protein S18 acetylase RimI-like enzyme